MERFVQAVVVIVGMAAGLLCLALGNEYLLRATEVAQGVHWIYLPAGLRMCFVLVLPAQGTVAIFAASLLLASRDPTFSLPLVAASAGVTAASPVLARTVAIQHLGLRPNLENLTSRMLWTLAAVFGIFSTSLHQAFYSAIGRESAFLSMWIGDTLGCLLCLYSFKGLSRLWGHWILR